MDDLLVMSAKERRWLAELSRVKNGQLSVAEAARLVGASERQARRRWKRYCQQGDGGLVHRLRGRPSNAVRPERRAQAVARYRQRYTACNVAHAAELLAREGLRVPRNTLWRWLDAEHLVTQPRQVKKHRQRRRRRECVGELVQMDGSPHAWFGPDIAECTLFVTIDDATGRVLARFYPQETTAAAFDLFGRYVRAYGLPQALYVDRASIYRVNNRKLRQACRERGVKPPLTQFGRAMQELGVRIICAHSPQAKGRVERANRTLQGRLPQELALELEGRGITDLAAGNRFLAGFLRRFNQRFMKAPAKGINVHRQVPTEVQLKEVLCAQSWRTVGQDWCVSYQGQALQIAPRHAKLALAGKKILVLELASGRLELRHEGQTLRHQAVEPRVLKQARKKLTLADRTPWRPGPDHPWRKPAVAKRGTAAPGR